MPSLMWQVQPACSKSRWCWPQTKVRLSMSVGPSGVQGVTWWVWHQAGGMSQPGKEQPRSRPVRAMRWRGEATRRVRPWARMPPASVRRRGMMSASPARCRAWAMLRVPPWAVVASPVRVLQLVQGHGDDDGGRGAAGVGEVPAAQEPVRGVVEGVVAALLRATRITNTAAATSGGVSAGVSAGVAVGGGGGVGCGEAVEQGLPFPGAAGGELTAEPGGPVRALGQGHLAAVVSFGFPGEGAVGVEVVADAAGQPGDDGRFEVVGVTDQGRLHRLGVLGLDRVREPVDGVGDEFRVRHRDHPGGLGGTDRREQRRQGFPAQPEPGGRDPGRRAPAPGPHPG
jgi:hypothetical protein